MQFVGMYIENQRAKQEYVYTSSLPNMFTQKTSSCLCEHYQMFCQFLIRQCYVYFLLCTVNKTTRGCRKSLQTTNTDNIPKSLFAYTFSEYKLVSINQYVIISSLRFNSVIMCCVNAEILL